MSKYLEPRSSKQGLDTTNAHAPMRCELADNLFPAYYKIIEFAVLVLRECCQFTISLYRLSISKVQR